MRQLIAKRQIRDMHRQQPMQHSTTNFSCSRPHFICRCHLPESQRPCLMCHVVDQCRSLPTNPHMPQLMHVCLNWCCFLSANITCKMLIGLWWRSLTLANAHSAYSMHTQHGRWVQVFVDSTDRSRYCLLKVHKPFLMVPIIGQHQFHSRNAYTILVMWTCFGCL